MTPTFHSLTIADVRRETADAVSLAFVVPDPLRAAYAFQPGQYLTLRGALDGEEVRRSYSICSGLDDGELRVAIKRIPDGVFSAFAHEALRPGDVLDVMTPMGRFTPSADIARRLVLLVAAGSGITPVLSIAKSLLAREPATEVFLVYGNRTTGQIMFRRELEDLKDRHLGRFSVLHILSREDHGAPLLSGRIDGDKIETVVTRTLARAPDEAFLCGPQAMTEAVRARLLALGLAPERVHVELFTAQTPARARPKPAAADAEAIHTVPVTLTLAGRQSVVEGRLGETVLEAGRRAGLDVPFACTGGMCCTCRAKLVEGHAPMDVNYSLEPWELQQGFVLTCQARLTDGPVRVDYDAV